MPTNTPNFNLVKPTQEEFYNVDVPNNNLDIIDRLIKELQDAITSGATEKELTVLKEALTSHLADTVKHITATERTTWNGKAPAVHTHSIEQIAELQTALDSKIDESMKNAPDGVAGLGPDGKLPVNQMPSESVAEIELLRIMNIY